MATALITGASSGLGREFAGQLAARGHDVVLVARDRGRLEALARELRAAHGVHVEVLPADLADRADLGRVADRVADPTRPVGLLVNNAGYGLHTPFVADDLAVEERFLDVLVRAVLVLSHAAARAMVARGRGAILNVSSIAALTAMGTYAAHKAWVLTFTEGLAAELHGTGVTATALVPGLVHTDFHRRAGWHTMRYPDLAWLDAPDVVRRALADAGRGAVLSVPSRRYAFVGGVARVAPHWAIRALSRMPGLR